MRVTWLDAGVFVAEVAVYVAVGCAAWRAARSPWGVVAVLLAIAAMATWWGLLHAPRALVHLPGPVDGTLRLGWFLIGAAATWAYLSSSA